MRIRHIVKRGFTVNQALICRKRVKRLLRRHQVAPAARDVAKALARRIECQQRVERRCTLSVGALLKTRIRAAVDAESGKRRNHLRCAFACLAAFGGEAAVWKLRLRECLKRARTHRRDCRIVAVRRKRRESHARQIGIDRCACKRKAARWQLAGEDFIDKRAPRGRRFRLRVVPGGKIPTVEREKSKNRAVHALFFNI